MKIDNLKGLSDIELKKKLKVFLTSENSVFDWYDFDKEYENLFGKELFYELFWNNAIEEYKKYPKRQYIYGISLKRNELFVDMQYKGKGGYNTYSYKCRVSVDDLRDFISNFIDTVNKYHSEMEEFDNIWGNNTIINNELM